jgi:hypothetical protein
MARKMTGDTGRIIAEVSKSTRADLDTVWKQWCFEKRQMLGFRAWFGRWVAEEAAKALKVYAETEEKTRYVNYATGKGERV